MRIARSALDQVRSYAVERGCTKFDEAGRRFFTPDKSRHVRISEISTYCIYIWDTAEGRVSIPREGRNARIIRSKAKKGDDAEGDPCGRPSAHEERKTV
jgi:hypothetical protein